MSVLEAPVPGATTLPAERVVTDADVLERAADLLEEQGWTQGSIGLPWEEWHAGRRPMQ
jgi:hypothetical protein